MAEPQPFTDDELAQARNAPLGWTARRWLATVDALRAALAARPQTDEPTALEMVTDLHRAIYGDTWARPESPRQVWELLLTKVRGLASGWCGECERRAARAAVAGRPQITSSEPTPHVCQHCDQPLPSPAGSATRHDPEIDGRLRIIVFRALDNAVANGYQVSDPGEEAAELVALDADLDGVLPERIAPYVAAWKTAVAGSATPTAAPGGDQLS